MKPNPESSELPVERRPFRVLVISGSQRRQYNCPGVDSKSRALMLRMADRLPPEWEIDLEDLGNVYKRERIQPCNACASTSMALCVWPCNCYQKNDGAEPDLMWNLDLYARLELADAWAILGPHNWYGPSTNLKAMFDRLVCMSGGNPREELIAHKDPERAMALEHSPEWEELSINHLEGRTAGFFCYGDEGADEVGEDGRPKKLRHKGYFDPSAEPFQDARDAYAPLVWQCRYSGIEVPDALWRYCTTGKGKPYSDDQAEDMVRDGGFLRAFDEWTDAFAAFVRGKGKVPPARYSAVGYDPPKHRWADTRLKWRQVRMSLGAAPAGSSPAEQEALGLNRDATFHPERSENTRNP
ncbi:MAG: Multimeric flavodoxin WrbA [uncultured Gemmatimonadetes bacterium]|uniref:Multimeric flavodoxin WrbA n=1 Tax=uncultured Gemmatimonadota bacterium TaxID=203437 RepID=A0A6J4MD15_9BACT|nr:MAG: Multimeric flavodoxin WrbA [uncultured Gemmatimonadota bacterium]